MVFKALNKALFLFPITEADWPKHRFRLLTHTVAKVQSTNPQTTNLPLVDATWYLFLHPSVIQGDV